MWTNIVEEDRPQMAIWRIRIACWIPKVTDTLSQYVIIIAFQWQQWFRERTMLVYEFFPFENVYQFTRSVQKQPDNSKDDRSV